MKQAVKCRINLDVHILISWHILIKELIELKLLSQTLRCGMFVHGDPSLIFEVEKVSNFDGDDRGDPIPIFLIIACLPAKGICAFAQTVYCGGENEGGEAGREFEILGLPGYWPSPIWADGADYISEDRVDH